MRPAFIKILFSEDQFMSLSVRPVYELCLMNNEFAYNYFNFSQLGL